MGAIVSISGADKRDTRFYRDRLADIRSLLHFTVELVR